MPAYKDKHDGSWESLFYYTDWTGKTKRKHKRGFSTKKEALNFESEYKRVAKANMGMKLASFVEVYFADKASELKERTMRNKRYMVQTHLIPYLGDKPMNEITPADVIQWQNTIIENNKFSEAYLRMLQNQITGIFNHAQKIYNLQNNPCKKVRKMGRSDDRSLSFWTYEEYVQFIETFDKGSMHFVMFEILFWTGIREGELLALTMDDFDLIQNRMKIDKTYFRMHGEDVITTPKTVNSIRTIELPDFIVDEVKSYYKELYKHPGDQRLFPIVAEALQHVMKRHIKKSGVKQIRVHDLRHSHCAYLINHGVQPLIIKERLGHKDIKVTLNTYGHLYPSEQKKIANMLNDLKESEKRNNNE